jgi:hypothetical protein
METHATKRQKGRQPEGIVYRTVCQNAGCGHSFDLRITPKDVALLSGTMACPRCRRHGGMLKPAGRIAEKLFAAKLMFRSTGISPAATGAGEENDLVSDMMGSSY